MNCLKRKIFNFFLSFFCFTHNSLCLPSINESNAYCKKLYTSYIHTRWKQLLNINFFNRLISQAQFLINCQFPFRKKTSAICVTIIIIFSSSINSAFLFYTIIIKKVNSQFFFRLILTMT